MSSNIITLKFLVPEDVKVTREEIEKMLNTTAKLIFFDVKPEENSYPRK